MEDKKPLKAQTSKRKVPHTNILSSQDFLAGGGEMGKMMRSFDWSNTAVGPIETWPQSLRTAVSIVLNSAFPMFIWWGKDDLTNFYNDPYTVILGKKHPNALGRPGKEAWAEIWDEVGPLAEQVFATGKPIFMKNLPLTMNRHGYDEQTYFTFSYSPIRDESGGIGGLYCACVETTNEIHAEAALQTERDKLRNLFMQAPTLVMVFRGPDHVIELANQHALRVWGKKHEEEVLNKPLLKAVPELKGQGIKELLDEVYTSGKAHHGKELLVRLYGDDNEKLEDMYFTFVYEPMRNPSGIIEGIMVYAYIVTDQVIARKKVEESEHNFRVMSDAVPHMVWTIEPDGRISYINKQWAEWSGLTIEKINTGSWNEVYHPDDLPKLAKGWTEAFASGKLFEWEYRIKNPQGGYSWFMGKTAPVYDEKGKLIRWVGTATNVDERKRSAQQKDEFIGIASHELKTPVTSIKAYTQLLDLRFRKAKDERSSELVRKMDGQLNKLTLLINDLLDVTKIEGGKLNFHKEYFDMNDLITEIVDELQRTTTKHKIYVKLGKTKLIYGDRDRLGQVLTNFITNAIKYSPLMNKIYVKSTLTSRHIQVSVQDFGVGIPNDKKDKVFERFYRVEGEKQDTYGGLGLGLYISQEIINRHQGKIWVESEAGKGSTFYFSLPLTTRK